MATYEIEKFILNADEFVFPSGGGVDEATVNCLISIKMKDFDGLFRDTESGLYEILNNLDSEDSCGLTAGDTRSDIVSNQTSMNLVSHSWAVMTAVASSEYAMNTLLASNNATKEVSECWNSISTIANSSIARSLFLKSEYGNYYLDNYAVTQDAFKPILLELDSIELATLLTHTSFYDSIMGNSEVRSLLSPCSFDDLVPAICVYAGLTGYTTWEEIENNGTALNTVFADSQCVNILSASSYFISYLVNNFDLLAQNETFVGILVDMGDTFNELINNSATWTKISLNAMFLNKIAKSSTAVGVLTNSSNNAILQTERVNLYNTVTGNSTYFTQTARTYNRTPANLNSSCTADNLFVFFNGGYYSSSASVAMRHANGVEAVRDGADYRPTSIAANSVNGVSFSGCTFTLISGNSQSAIAVYQAV